MSKLGHNLAAKFTSLEYQWIASLAQQNFYDLGGDLRSVRWVCQNPELAIT